MVWCYCKLLYHSLQVLTRKKPHCQQVHLSGPELKTWAALMLKCPVSLRFYKEHELHWTCCFFTNRKLKPSKAVSLRTIEQRLSNFSSMKTRAALGFLDFEIAINVQLGRMLKCFMLKFQPATLFTTKYWTQSTTQQWETSPENRGSVRFRYSVYKSEFE